MGAQPSGNSPRCRPRLAWEVLSQVDISDLSLECDHSRVCFVVVFCFLNFQLKNPQICLFLRSSGKRQDFTAEDVSVPYICL